MTNDAAYYQRDGYIARIRLNRPETGNRIDREILLALDRALIAAEEDIDARIVIVEAAGDDFCVGEAPRQSTPYLQGPGAAVADELQNARRLQYLANLPRATIAVVRGCCAGVGLTLAMLCDFVVCSDDAVFSDPSVSEGGVPSFALWPFFAWHKISKQLMFGGELSGGEAERLGLVSKAVPDVRLAAEVQSYVDLLLLASADALAWNKEMISSCIEARGGGRMWRDSAIYHALGTVPA